MGKIFFYNNPNILRFPTKTAKNILRFSTKTTKNILRFPAKVLFLRCKSATKNEQSRIYIVCLG
jgi:hypothetical protein